ncbi:MAG TPA: LEPR-XLL domain-containing protein, partial [Ramlibacter sp.]|nr:LEPR-XLL domain-containing protein [Ramlibacter sp.]
MSRGWSVSEVLRKVGASALSLSRLFPRRDRPHRDSPPFRRKLVFEMLEQRLLLSADPIGAVDDHGVLRPYLTEGADQVVISRTAAADDGGIIIDLTVGGLTQTFGTQQVGITSVEVDGLGGDDRFVIVDLDKPLTVSGGGGNDTLTVRSGNTGSVSFIGGAGNADTVVNRQGTSGRVTVVDVETQVDRPLLFVPGFGGSFVNASLADDPGLAGDTAVEEWLLNRGLHPDRLQLEPLSEAYSDMVRTLANVGYVDGTAGGDGTLFQALWDWRVAVAPDDANADGFLANATASSLTDAWFTTGLDYFVYWVDKASDAWMNLTGSAPGSVDVLTHSTGGLIARSYIQSDAYTDAAAGLPAVNMLVQTGVPNQGTGSPFLMLNDDFSVKASTRMLALILNDAYTLWDGGATPIRNADGTVFQAASLQEFVGNYVESFGSLLPTYAFLDDGSGHFRALTADDPLFNSLLTDLNAHGADAFVARGTLDLVADALPDFLVGADADGDGVVGMAELVARYDAGDFDGRLSIAELPEAAEVDDGNDLGGAADGFVSVAELLRRYDRQTYIVYSDAVQTADLAVQHTGLELALGLENEILSLTETIIGHLPGASEDWFELQEVDG